MDKKKTLTVVGCVAALCAVGVLVTPVLKKHNENFPDAFNDVVLGERVKNFATTDSAPEPGDGEGLFVLPGWVPEDATDIKIKVQTTGNAKLIRFTLAGTGTPLELTGEGACHEGAFIDGPELEASWWPEDVGEGSGRPDCSEQYQLRVAVEGDDVYAWSNGDLAKAG
ncbi:hypothetical protein DVA86_01875 [Streptomyces armeniacus]|uniref:Uncharacterized protein n=1 Tax=Streptomyces armeniacus TaxID=83291 RepID=A0A345XIW0_9ACTN|nr:hypothetical protein [Streptomyces armeniacus]AXK31576.1 hypothetical protein DVA86_01875 [Streptomyces armeniacus]